MRSFLRAFSESRNVAQLIDAELGLQRPQGAW